MDKHSYLSNAEPAAVEQLYQQFMQDPASVDSGWRQFFEGFEFALRHFPFKAGKPSVMSDEFKVLNLINEYRSRGHLFTKTNPVRQRREYTPTLDIENFGLAKTDLDRVFEAGSEIGLGVASLRNILARLEQTYCQSIGAEYMFIRNKAVSAWLRERMEQTQNTPAYSHAEKKAILNKLAQAVLFEKFLHRKFTGQKRFSLEGAESLIPSLDAVVEQGAKLGAEEFVIGMAHRGRLNTLANIMQKPYHDIFNEFQHKQYDDEALLGDVKYHQGYTSVRNTAGGKRVTLSLSPNPSHLEAVNPVVEGIARSLVDRKYEGDYNKVVPILIHGDASIAGQGIVYEVLQMSGLNGYKTGGTIHLVINNQIGFTTNYLDARTSIYCTDVAKTIQSPVFHVNGDDAEAVVYTIQLAMDFRAKFNQDVFVDILCYRRHGHNEGDEPRFTQPVLYKTIEQHPDPFRIYSNKLLQQQVITERNISTLETSTNEMFEEALARSQQLEKARVTPFFRHIWEGIRPAHENDFNHSIETGVDEQRLIHLGQRLTEAPVNLPLNRKIIRLLEDRRNMLAPAGKLDWGMAELMAYATLLNEGIPVRLSGQDVERGTFSHRHAVLTIEDSEQKYVPLSHLDEGQAKFEVYNSLLSEYGVLGFEYGYSLGAPNSLVIWEAQFGDFANSAQIIIDQYISSAEEKWRLMNALVMLLPHGYEGQGPEHSSARLERFLSLCADNNMMIANCTTPANFFHLLRRQVKTEYRKPLVVFTPKSLLRHPKCVSLLSDFTAGSFAEVIDDASTDPENIKRVIFCSGKVYYDLAEERERSGRRDTAIIRLEQLYPFPTKQLNALINKYKTAEVYAWVQEEPANMGAWTFISRQFRHIELLRVSRPESGSPATGSVHLHNLRQRKVVEKAFGECVCPRAGVACKMLCAPEEWRPPYVIEDVVTQ